MCSTVSFDFAKLARAARTSGEGHELRPARGHLGLRAPPIHLPPLPVEQELVVGLLPQALDVRLLPNPGIRDTQNELLQRDPAPRLPRENGAINNGIPRINERNISVRGLMSEVLSQLVTRSAVTEERLFSGRAPMLAEASPGFTIFNGRGDDAHAVDMYDAARRSTAGHREGGGSEAHVVDEGGGRADSIAMGGMIVHGSAAAARTTNISAIDSFYKLMVPVSNLIEPAGNAVPRQLVIEPRAVEMVIVDILRAQRYTARARERGGTQAHVVDGGGGHAVSIAMGVHAPQQSDQASVAAAPTTNLTVVQQVLSAVLGGLVVLSVSNLHGTSTGDYPEFIKLGLFAAFVLLVVLTFLGLMIKKMGKVAMRVVAGMSITAMTIAAVYQVSEKVYIKCIIGIMGAIGTMVMGLIN